MNNEELINEISILKAELEKTKFELVETKEHLKKYTAPSNMKKYYQNQKKKIKEKVKKYKENYTYTPTEEQKKKWARTAYLNKKAKLEKEKLEKENI